MIFSAASLHAMLETQVPPGATGLVVALSGGVDSACLATALAQLGAATAGSPSPDSDPTPTLSLSSVLGLARAPAASSSSEPAALIRAAAWRRLPLRALHVDHGLQSAAAEFRAACGNLCRKLDLALDIIDVAVVTAGGVSLEAAAREARYNAIARRLEPGECLLTAHHAEDQAETLLLQLLRGAGLKGLSAMPVCRPLGAGFHLRPLLDTSKCELLRFAQENGIVAVADPMNHDLRFDRAYLRGRLWPLLEARWPGATTALARTARHAADAQELLDESASLAVRKLTDGEALSVTGLRVLPPLQQLNALRYWLVEQGVTPPPSARLIEALRQITDAGAQHLPAVRWGGHALRRYRDRVFVTPALPPRIGDPLQWPVGPASTLALGAGLGTLRFTPQAGGLDASRLPLSLTVRRRRGGESLKAHHKGRTRSLQHLCQAFGVLPWMRDALPLLFAGDTLIAIGDLWMETGWCAPRDAAGLGVVWDDAPSLA